MRKITKFAWLLALVLSFTACKEDHKTEESTTIDSNTQQNTNSNNSSQDAQGKPPWKIDSSKIQVTASGLKYYHVLEGFGNSPTIEDKVMCHYHGTLTDGTVFDSSYDRGEPSQFPLMGVIKGWQEGIPLMKVGGKTVFIIPPDLGYGEKGTPNIPPNSDLVFYVELLNIF